MPESVGKPGEIHRISLQNFLTYNFVVLDPGSNLNLIIGPNGSGKSTFVCAIVLGLCGKPSILGRENKVSKYVRSGCKEAAIEIELYTHDNKKNVIIQRQFDLTDKTTWYIDRKVAKEIQVKNLVSSLNIQVDNLCQMLPQDKVQDFAKMDAQQLLRSTLAAVGTADAVPALDELIQYRENQRNLTLKYTNNIEKLKEQKQLHERLKTQVEAIEMRNEIKKDIRICELKKLWIEYDNLRRRVMDYEKDKKDAEKISKVHTDGFKTLQNEINSSKSELQKHELGNQSLSNSILTMKNEISKLLDIIKVYMGRIKETEKELKEKLLSRETRANEIKNAQMLLKKLNHDKSDLLSGIGDEEKSKASLLKYHEQVQVTNKYIDAANSDKTMLKFELDTDIIPQIVHRQDKIGKLKNVKNKTLRNLKSLSSDAYNAWDWLQQNREMFESNVYDPMALDINLKEQKFAQYFEKTVSQKDLFAFSFESKNDMNKFIQKVRGELRLKTVNAVLVGKNNPSRSPPVPLNNIKHLGFYTYLVDTINAPNRILTFLCQHYGIHRIPITNAKTWSDKNQLPSSINNFYTEKHSHSINVSKYSGAKITSISEVRPPRIFTDTINQEELQQCENELEQLKMFEIKKKEAIQNLNTKLDTLQNSLNSLLTERKKIEDVLVKVKNVNSKLNLQKVKIDDLERQPDIDIKVERNECKKNITQFVLKQCELQEKLLQKMKDFHSKCLEVNSWKASIVMCRNKVLQLESELRELKNTYRDIENTLQNINKQLSVTKTHAKEKLEEARTASSGHIPNSKNFPYNSEFSNLPDNLDELNTQRLELLGRISALADGSDQVLEEFQECESKIEQLSKILKEYDTEVDSLKTKMENVKTQWLHNLNQLIPQISRRFSSMFTQLKCTGEVKLQKAGDDDDFDKYGIEILVAFRKDEQLQKLNRHTQSGGERSLTTAMYLLALQQLSKVPFRCVDEINQGMDPTNERNMLKILIDVTTRDSGGQYFLLTPKLQPDLEYNSRVMIHTVMNGPSLVKNSKWDFTKFLEAAKNLKDM